MSDGPYPASPLFDLAAARRGERLNRLGHRLRDPGERAALAADPAGWIARARLSADERAALDARDWPALSAMGASVYALAKIAPGLGTPLPALVAALRDGAP